MLTLAELMRRNIALSILKDDQTAHAQAFTLKQDLATALDALPALRPFTRQKGHDECCFETRGGKNMPFLQVAYEVVFGTQYATELTVRLRKNVFNCQVTTWQYTEGNQHYLGPAEIALNGELDTVVQGDGLESLAAAAVTAAIEHRIELLTRECGFELSDSTRDALLAQRLQTLLV